MCQHPHSRAKCPWRPPVGSVGGAAVGTAAARMLMGRQYAKVPSVGGPPLRSMLPEAAEAAAAADSASRRALASGAVLHMRSCTAANFRPCVAALTSQHSAQIHVAVRGRCDGRKASLGRALPTKQGPRWRGAGSQGRGAVRPAAAISWTASNPAAKKRGIPGFPPKSPGCRAHHVHTAHTKKSARIIKLLD